MFPGHIDTIKIQKFEQIWNSQRRYYYDYLLLSNPQGHADHHHIAASRGVCEEARGRDEARRQQTQGPSKVETEGNDTEICRSEFTYKVYLLDHDS